MKLGKYGIWTKKYLKEYKPFKSSRLVMDYLFEFELREKFSAPSENESFVEQVNYIHMIQEMVDEFVMEEVKLV